MYKSRIRIAIGMTVGLLSAGLLALAAGMTGAKSPAGLIVHEWGTFLVMNGSDGVALDGMYHEEHALPGFVHARSKDQLRVPAVSVKGETPVIYFYSQQAQNLSVGVQFPQGIWTQWYPQAQYNGPLTAQAGSPPQLRNGHITWRVRIAPPDKKVVSLPKTPAGSLWDYAREVDADFVRPDPQEVNAPGEVERFLFYRGLGEARLPLRMDTSGSGLLSYDADQDLPLRSLFLIRVENGRAAYRYVPSLAPGARLADALPSLREAMPQAQFRERIGEDLAKRLAEAGLYPKEARAMVNTWRSSYFDMEGIRVLFLLPQAWTDRFIPLTISPAPSHVVRVMVGRLEVLTPDRERHAETAVRDLASADESIRRAAHTFLRDQGRYLEPIIRRTLRTSQDERVQTLCTRLLATDFVTELQAAVTGAPARSASEGMDVLDARAQLACLLREIGRNGEAADEARRILPDVQSMPTPSIASSGYRQYARIHARTLEALGDERGAVHWYSKFIQFGSQSGTCGGCHHIQGPTGLVWYRDWWAGRKYALFASRTETPEGAVARQLAALKADPSNIAIAMRLAYLYEQHGDRGRADALWAILSAQQGRNVSLNRR